MIENQVYLAEGSYAKVIGRSAELLAVCEAMHYALVALHLRIQTAAAYEKLGKTEEARAWLEKALSDAAPDGLVMPFLENYDYIRPLLARETQSPLAAQIMALGEAAKARNTASARPAVFDALTTREYEIVELMVETVCARRKTTRIAGSDFPHEVVRSRFLKLDCSHIEFVMECLRNNTTEIRNMKQYLLAVLFNAPTTISNHYTAQVNHDMYAGGW